MFPIYTCSCPEAQPGQDECLPTPQSLAHALLLRAGKDFVEGKSE